MEGVGSRLGRASSRYGPSSATAIFNGPVRKWKRKWVHVAPPPPSNNNSNRHTSMSSSHNLLLRCWTPLSPAPTSSSDEEPPKRKFRYTPVAVLEEQKKTAAKKVEGSNAGESQRSAVARSESGDKNDKVTKREEPMQKETEDSNTGLDLGLFLKGHNSDQDGDQSDKGQMN